MRPSIPPRTVLPHTFVRIYRDCSVYLILEDEEGECHHMISYRIVMSASSPHLVGGEKEKKNPVRREKEKRKYSHGIR